MAICIATLRRVGAVWMAVSGGTANLAAHPNAYADACRIIFGAGTVSHEKRILSVLEDDEGTIAQELNSGRFGTPLFRSTFDGERLCLSESGMLSYRAILNCLAFHSFRNCRSLHGFVSDGML